MWKIAFNYYLNYFNQLGLFVSERVHISQNSLSQNVKLQTFMSATKTQFRKKEIICILYSLNTFNIDCISSEGALQFMPLHSWAGKKKNKEHTFTEQGKTHTDRHICGTDSDASLAI